MLVPPLKGEGSPAGPRRSARLSCICFVFAATDILCKITLKASGLHQ